MAANYANRLQAVYPAGPYKLLGWSLGGVVAHELAVELQRRGCEVQRLVLIDDAISANRVIATNQSSDESQVLDHMLRINRIDIPEQSGPLTRQQAVALIHEQLEAAEFALPPKELLEFAVQSVAANQLYLQEHVPEVFDGDMVIFAAARDGNMDDSSQLQSWRAYVSGDITTHLVDCTHHEMLTTGSLNIYGGQLKLALEA
jgi:thioesterase domain-containing protein